LVETKAKIRETHETLTVEEDYEGKSLGKIWKNMETYGKIWKKYHEVSRT